MGSALFQVICLNGLWISTQFETKINRYTGLWTTITAKVKFLYLMLIPVLDILETLFAVVLAAIFSGAQQKSWTQDLFPPPLPPASGQTLKITHTTVSQCRLLPSPPNFILKSNHMPQFNHLLFILCSGGYTEPPQAHPRRLVRDPPYWEADIKSFPTVPMWWNHHPKIVIFLKIGFRFSNQEDLACSWITKYILMLF